MFYPSAPLLLRTWTATRFPDFRVATDAPANLQQVIAAETAVIRVQRYGGPSGVLTIDRPSFDVDVFAASWDDADSICNRVRSAWEFEMPGAFIDLGADGRATVARVQTTSGPSGRPVTDPGLSRCGASFTVWLHAHAVAAD